MRLFLSKGGRHERPFDRDKHNNPIARKRIVSPTLAGHDQEALEEVAQAIRSGSEPAERLEVWLRAKNAIAADRNIDAVRHEILQRQSSRTGEVRAELDQTQSALRSLHDAEAEVMPKLERLAGQHHVTVREDGSVLPFADNEPISKEELAGRENLPVPKLEDERASKRYRAAVSIGGGGIGGASLGMLTDAIDLQNRHIHFMPLVFFCGLGILLMWAVGGAFVPLGRRVGEDLYRASIGSKNRRVVVAVGWLAFLIVVTVAMVFIESRVDSLGIFKGLTQQTTFHGVHLSPADMLLVSLFIIVPVITLYLVQGTLVGYGQGNMARLAWLQWHERDKLVQTESFGELQVLAGKLKSIRARASELTPKQAQLEARTGDWFTEEELHQLEDLENDAITYSEELKQHLYPSMVEKRGESRHVPRPENLWTRILAFFRR